MDPRHPELRALHDLWNEKRGNRRMPAWRDFSVHELKRWLGNLNLLDILDGGADLRFRVYGTKVAATFGVDHTGQRVSELPPAIAATIWSDYAEAIREGHPAFVVRRQSVYKDFVRTEKLILPLSQDGAVPDMVLVGVYGGRPDRSYPGN